MRRISIAIAKLIAMFAAGTAMAQPAPPPTGSEKPDPEDANLIRAHDLIQAHRAAEAIAILDQIIANERKAYAGEKRTIYCARALPETLLYMTMAAKAKASAIAIGPTWATAVFFKGFALIDMGRSEEAKPLYEEAIRLSPMNAQFLAELGEWYRTHGDLEAAYAQFQKASDAAAFSPDAVKSIEKRRALRGMAFVLTDQGKLDEAEALYRQCLALDPTDEHAKYELEYIRRQRVKLLHGT